MFLIWKIGLKMTIWPYNLISELKTVFFLADIYFFPWLKQQIQELSVNGQIISQAEFFPIVKGEGKNLAEYSFKSRIFVKKKNCSEDHHFSRIVHCVCIRNMLIYKIRYWAISEAMVIFNRLNIDLSLKYRLALMGYN